MPGLIHQRTNLIPFFFKGGVGVVCRNTAPTTYLSSFFNFWSSENNEELVPNRRVVTNIMVHKRGVGVVCRNTAPTIFYLLSL